MSIFLVSGGCVSDSGTARPLDASRFGKSDDRSLCQGVRRYLETARFYQRKGLLRSPDEPLGKIPRYGSGGDESALSFTRQRSVAEGNGSLKCRKRFGLKNSACCLHQC